MAISDLWGGVRRVFGADAIPAPSWGDWVAERPAQLYAMLESYYRSNDLYRDISMALATRGVHIEGMLPLRNPTFRVVEFYAAKLWPTLPIETEVTKADELRAAIEQVWTWSNWSTQKQVAARRFAMLGDLFIKVATRADRSRVYFQLIEPAHVVDFDTDERGYLTYCRIDVPQIRREGDKIKAFTHTEVWTKESYRRWEHDRSEAVEVSDLGAPLEELPLRAFGINFVPIVHAKFRDVGDARGTAAVTAALDKIDEANRQATRLHQMLFRYSGPLWALQAGVGIDGRPLPPPVVGDAERTVMLGESAFVALPGNTTLAPMVPNLRYGDALTILQDQMAEIEKDLPELAYSRLREKADLSGRAVQFLLGDAIGRAIEARGNAEAALIRANQMALTIGANVRLPQFQGLGKYESGDFNHTFEERDIIPLTGMDRTEEAKTEAEMLLLRRELGISQKEAQLEMGYDETRIGEMEAERGAESGNVGGALLREFDAGAGQ